MENNKILSFAGLTCLLLSAILLVVSLITTNWIVVETSIDMMKYNKELEKKTPSSLKGAIITQSIWYGLTSFCVKASVDLSNVKLMLRTQIQANEESKVCVDFDKIKSAISLMPFDSDAKSVLLDMFYEFHNTLICSAIFTTCVFIAVLTALLKTPCVKIQMKHMMHLITLLMTIIAVIPGIASLIVFDKNLYQKYGTKSLIQIASPGSKMTAKQLEFLKSFDVEVEKGIAFQITIAAVICVFLGFIFNLLELTSKRNEENEEVILMDKKDDLNLA